MPHINVNVHVVATDTLEARVEPGSRPYVVVAIADEIRIFFGIENLAALRRLGVVCIEAARELGDIGRLAGADHQAADHDPTRCRECLGVEPPAVNEAGRYVCCQGFGEHFENCTVGLAIASARRAVGRPTPLDEPTIAELADDAADAGAYDGVFDSPLGDQLEDVVLAHLDRAAG